MSELIEMIKSGDPLSIFITIVGILLINYENVFTFFNDLRHRKVNQYKELLNNDVLDLETKNYLKSRINDEVFYLSTGISNNKFFRKRLLSLYEQGKGDFSLLHVKLAQQYVDFSDKKICIKIHWMEWLFGIVSTVFGILTIVGSYFILQTGLSSADMMTRLFGLIAFLLFFVIGLIGLFQALVLHIATNKLQPVFNKLQKDNTDSQSEEYSEV